MIKFVFSPLARGIALACTMGSSAALAGVNINHQEDVVVNTERVLVQKHFVLHALPPVTLQQTQTQEVTEALSLSEFVKDSAIRFVSGKHYLTGSTKAEMDRIVALLQGKKQLKLHFIGHADNQRLSPNARKIYSDNQDLSEHRAEIVADYFAAQLQLDSTQVSTEGRADREPVASNDTLAGMARNRRVEVLAVYVEEHVVTKTLSEYSALREQICGGVPQTSQALSLSLDGIALAADDSANNADAQRCADVALEKLQLQFKYDPLRALPKLSVQHALTQSGNGLTLHLQGHSNYLSFIDFAEIQLLLPNRTLLAKVTLDENLRGQWQLPNNLLGMRLQYRLRVFNKQGEFDETYLQEVDFRPQFAVTTSKLEGYLQAGQGESQLAKQTIRVEGGTLTLFGEQVPLQHHVYFLGRIVAVNRERRFIQQQIVQSGLHRAEVAVLDDKGNGRLITRDLALPQQDWFYVAMADLTLGQRDHRGSMVLLNDGQKAQDDLFAEARLAGYVKGKFAQGYRISAKIDTKEQPLEQLLSGLHHQDPQSLLRRLEEEQHHAEVGDDSFVEDDTPSQGKVYVRVENDTSHLLWGNFATHSGDTELARIERGLYGLELNHLSAATTSQGEAALAANVYVAQAQTMSSYEEQRATGGSLFYLKHRDIVRGSARVAVEIRDKTSGLVLVRRALSEGQDYDLDALQGRILLSKPLSSFEQDDLLVRAAALDNNPVYLVSSYEYAPSFDELDNLSYGARLSHWLNDQVQLGVTASKQEQDGFDSALTALDATYQVSESAYIKIEAAQSEGLGVGLSSDNGGLTFTTYASGTEVVKANAYFVEAKATFADFGLEQQGDGQFYWQRLGAGYAGLGLLSRSAQTKQGARLQWQMSEQMHTQLKLDSREDDLANQTQAVELNTKLSLTNNVMVSLGVRIDQREQHEPVGVSSEQGTRSDAVVQLSKAINETTELYGFVQGTLAREYARQSNNRVGLGGRWQASEKLALQSELSTGNLGLAGNFGLEYQIQQDSNLYLNYQLDPDGRDNLLGQKQGNWTSGARHRFSEATSVYAEQQYQHNNLEQGLMQAYGIEHQLNAQWQVSVGVETGTLDTQSGRADRDVLSLALGYGNEALKWTSALEYRTDDSASHTLDAWLMRHNFSWKYDENWRAQARLDLAFSDAEQAKDDHALLNSRFTELQLGVAYRPIDNSPWSGLATLTYLADLAPAEQLSGLGRAQMPQQKSTVMALDVAYQINPSWRFGSRFAYRNGEVRAGRDEGQWFDSATTLWTNRVDYHLLQQWDATLEWRQLQVLEAQDKRTGMLVALHRHFGEHVKAGIGYNFTDFSDDLTRLDYRADGWFLNVTGKF
ncbi:OmpA family protein [Pseudoalteromonas fenneropenaei]|uniref:OmpA family protein n=1 Tax=Pseudoalteromonas fenneropenaei TaxID=1737459 RepID=A0ABV7CGX1_9GAMM